MGIFSAEQQCPQEDSQWHGYKDLNKQLLGKSGLKLEASFQSATCPVPGITQRRPELPPGCGGWGDHTVPPGTGAMAIWQGHYKRTLPIPWLIRQQQSTSRD